MRQLRALLPLLLVSAAAAQTLVPQGAPSLPGVGRSAPLDVSSQLPGMILPARQLVLYAPALLRADVAEAIRRALTQRGAQVTLITTPGALFTDDSLSLRVLLMNVPTYLTAGQGVPFVLIDGAAVSGPGVAGPGTAALTTPRAAARLAGWAARVTRDVRPLDPVRALRSWISRRRGVLLP